MSNATPVYKHYQKSYYRAKFVALEKLANFAANHFREICKIIVLIYIIWQQCQATNRKKNTQASKKKN